MFTRVSGSIHLVSDSGLSMDIAVDAITISATLAEIDRVVAERFAKALEPMTVEAKRAAQAEKVRADKAEAKLRAAGEAAEERKVEKPSKIIGGDSNLSDDDPDAVVRGRRR